MINKEDTYVRDKLYMQRHPLLQPKMRTILLDWLMEVSFSVPESISNMLLLKYAVTAATTVRDLCIIHYH